MGRAELPQGLIPDPLTVCRGPPKGYVEALEHRLQVAEGVLLRVLSQVSDTQLLNAIPGEQGQNDRGVSYTPLARLEKKGVEDWPQFPLDTAQNIREWQRACIEHDSGDAGNLLEVETRPPIEYEQSRYERKKPWTASRPSESSEVHTGLSMPRRDGKKMAETPFAADQQLYQTPRNVQEATRRVPLDFSTLENREGVQPAQTQNSWSGAPSLNFQERFLW